MKYIVISCLGEETIHLFDPMFDHDRMFEAITTVKMGDRDDWERHLRTNDAEVVGAGFVTHNTCYGKSVTLGVSSREEDTALLDSVLCLRG